LLASILDNDKKGCCYLFMHDLSRPGQPASAAVAQIRVRFRSLWETSEWKIAQKAKNRQNDLRKEGWHRYHKN
jgi:hypothetical protein